MGKSNKSTRKYSKRHLSKELAQRKRKKFVNKQKQGREAKFQRSVADFKEKTIEEQARKQAEEIVRHEKENFLTRNQVIEEEDSDLVELPEEDGLESPAGDESILQSSSDEEDVDLEINEYKDQLESLKEQDPAFYQYLLEADKQLLDFTVSTDHTPPPDPINEDGARQLDLSRVENWCKEVKEGEDLDSLRCLMTAYLVACQHGSHKAKENLFEFTNSAVYTHLMSFTLKESERIFKKYFTLEKKQTITKQDIKKASKGKEEVVSQLCRFLSGSCLLLEVDLQDEILSFVLRQIRRFIIFMEFIPMSIQKRILRCSLEIFSSAKPAPRLQSILLIREMVIQGGDKVESLALKGIYRAFTLACQEVNLESIPSIYFMGTCVIEIYSLASDSAYQNAFKFLKDLASQLREAIILKEKDSWKKVFSWKFINCLELWSRLVGSLAQSEDVKELIYPVAQLLTGVARFQEQPHYLPMRLRLIAAINRLSHSTGVFIPVSSLLLGILSWSLLHKKPKIGLNERCPNMGLILQVDDKVLKSGVFQAEVVEQVMELLAQHLAQFSHTIAFPEMSHWIAFQLKKFAKTVQFPSYKSGAMQLVSAIKESATQVLTRRQVVTFSPKDIDKVQAFEVEGKKRGVSPLERLSEKLQSKRKERSAIYSKEKVVIVKEPSPEVKQPIKTKKEEDQMSLSDAKSLTSDDSDLDEMILEDSQTLGDAPQVDDILEEYVLSDDEIEETIKVTKKNKDNKRKEMKQKKNKNDGNLSKHQRRKEKRKLNRKKPSSKK